MGIKVEIDESVSTKNITEEENKPHSVNFS